MCAVIFGMDCARRPSRNLNWTIAIPDKLNNIARRKSVDEEDLHTPASVIADETPTSKLPLKIVQITDIHIDPYYTPGMNADCGEPLCCRPGDGLADSPGKAAGYWGDYRNCDTPVGTIRHALKHISETHSDV